MELWSKFWAAFLEIWQALLFLTPIIAVIVMVLAHRAYLQAVRANQTLDSVWIVLKAIRYRQEHPTGPIPGPGDPEEPGTSPSEGTAKRE